MFKCFDCGEVFESCGSVYEGVESWGTECNYEVAVCPYCNSDDFEEAVQCADCGEWYFYDETDCQLCPECKKKILKEYVHSAQKCFDLCNSNEKAIEDLKEKVEINAFLFTQFSNDDIERILLRELLEQEKISERLGTEKPSYIDFIDSDFYDRYEEKEV